MSATDKQRRAERRGFSARLTGPKGRCQRWQAESAFIRQGAVGFFERREQLHCAQETHLRGLPKHSSAASRRAEGGRLQASARKGLMFVLDLTVQVPMLQTRSNVCSPCHRLQLPWCAAAAAVLTCAPKADVLPKGEDAGEAPKAGWDWACPKPAAAVVQHFREV